MDETMAGYMSISQRLQETPVHPLFRAVHLSEKGTWRGSGTLILDRAGNHTGVATASHLFPIGREKEYLFYRTLQPRSPAEFPLFNARQATKEDVAICTPGMATRIGGFSHHQGGRWKNPKELLATKQSYPDCVCLATGEKVPVIGHFEEAQEYYYILQYHSYPGESGAGFLRSDNELYVLASGIDVDDALRKFLDIPATFTRVTLAAAIRIE